MTDLVNEPTWKRSAACSDSACVEVSTDYLGDEYVVLRNSTDPANSLAISREQWRHLIAAAQEGQFNV